MPENIRPVPMQKIYDIQFEKVDYTAVDTWLCRCALSAHGAPPIHVPILIVLKTLQANAIDTHDGISIAALVVEPALDILTAALEQERAPDKIRIPDTFIRSQAFAQKARAICERIIKGIPFHIVITPPSHSGKVLGPVDTRTRHLSSLSSVKR